MAYTTITDPSAYFQISTYDGNGSDDRNITYDGNSNMQPDFLWFKRRNQAVNHILFDSTRGVTSRIHSNNTNAAAIEANFLQAFNSDGFQVGTDADINGSGGTFVSWGWKANGATTASNASGSITSTTQANTTAGFSVVTYTGNGVNGATVGHSLGVVPQMIMVKRLDSAANWMVYHEAMGPTKAMFLDLTAASDTDAGYWSNTAPTTGIFNLGTNTKGNANGGTYVAYCFADKQGYSKFGSYTGNANADGSFIYTGFKPRFFMLKGTGNVSSWCMYDTVRDPINRASQKIWANENNAESSTGAMDFLSNGIKMRINDNDFNGSGYQYLYMAFAENPFVATNGVPTTAK
jgi:hypothetical protein